MRILFIGAIRRNGYSTVKALRSYGLECEILLGREQISTMFYDHQMHDIPHWVKIIDVTPSHFYSKLAYIFSANLKLKNYDLIHSRCLGTLLFFKLGIPYVEQTVGSDMREIAVGQNFLSKRVVRHYHNANKIIVSQTDHIKICKKLNLENYVYIPLMADTENYYPDNEKICFGNYDLTIFHPSRLDWTYTYGDRSVKKGNNKIFRSSTKGNDKLIKAVARLIKSGCNTLLIMLERGIDLKETKELVCMLGIEKHVNWLKEMDDIRLRRYYSSVDVVADQFDCGSLGLIAYDAMLCGAPVIGYLEEESAICCSENQKSLLNCQTEDDIYTNLFISNRNKLKRLGYEGRQWVLSNRSCDKIVKSLINIYNNVVKND